MIAHFSRLLLYCLRARASSPAERMGSTAMEKIRTASGHTAPQLHSSLYIPVKELQHIYGEAVYFTKTFPAGTISQPAYLLSSASGVHRSALPLQFPVHKEFQKECI